MVSPRDRLNISIGDQQRSADQGRRTGLWRKTDRHSSGPRIRARRCELALDQRAVAAVIGTSATRIEAYERGIERVEPERLLELSTLLDLPISGFFGEG